MARLHTGRDKVLSTYRSYHGNTGAAIVATGDWRRIPNEFARGHVHFFGPYLYRTEFWATTPEQESRARAAAPAPRHRGRGPVVDRRDPARDRPGHGRHPRAAARLPRRRARALPTGTASCSSSTRSWRVRPHRPLVRVRRLRRPPDLITFAKGVNSGYVPAGGVIISDPIAADFDERVFPGGLTYSGHPLAMASIVATLDAMESEEHRRERRARSATTDHRPGARRARRTPRRHRRGARRGRVLGASSSSPTARPASRCRPPRWAASRPRSWRAACCRSSQDNRIHVVPPCVVTDRRGRRGDRRSTTTY